MKLCYKLIVKALQETFRNQFFIASTFCVCEAVSILFIVHSGGMTKMQENNLGDHNIVYSSCALLTMIQCIDAICGVWGYCQELR